jgi:DNA primase
MNYYEQLKAASDICQVAHKLGFNGQKCGARWQGECPRHGSARGKCLTIYARTQSFYCFHCRQGGDVIKLVELFKNCEHRRAVNYLAAAAGLPPLEARELSSQELDRKEADYQEERLVRDLLTVAARWYQEQLAKFTDVQDYLENHYGFSSEIITELGLGFAPPPQGQSSALAQHLQSFPEFHGKLALCGLFTWKDPVHGPFYDFFKARIIFPYWKQGQVVYMKARATAATPVDKYECYQEKNDQVKYDAQGKPEYIKYKALRSHDPDDDKKKHISKFIQRDTFLGEDSIRGAKHIIITEGVPDWISALDHGFAALSPGTTNFREQDLQKLSDLTKPAEAIYLIFDNEDNRAGYEGALRTGKFLAQGGKQVFLVQLPKPAGVSKIDLNEYLKTHAAKDLKQLLYRAKTVPQMLIEALPQNFMQALPPLKEEIAPLLVNFQDGLLEHYVEMLRKQTKTSRKSIQAEITAARTRLKKPAGVKTESPPDLEIKKQAQALAQDPLLFKKRIDLVNESGVVGERKNIAMYFATLDSRLLPDNPASPNALALKNAGHFGSGKSYTLLKVLAIYPEPGYCLITGGSQKSLYYLAGGLKHKALIVTEGFQFQQEQARDSELVYVVRSLISEGRISYWVPEKDEAEGKMVTKEKKLEGPTAFITTTIMEKLEAQLEDRLFTIHPDESIEQTRDIISLTAELAAGQVPGLETQTVEVWKALHQLLQPVEVVIPFAPDLAAYINQKGLPPIATRRAFKRVLSVIKAIGCAYQYQRQRDKANRVVADIADYYMALQIVRESFQESLGHLSALDKSRVHFIQQQEPVLFKKLATDWALSKAGVTTWVRKRVQDGILQWCDKDGVLYRDKEELRRAKHAGEAFLKIAASFLAVDTSGLPSPHELSKDPAWDETGELFEKYDLQLNQRAQVKQKSSQVRETLSLDDAPVEEDQDEDEGLNILPFKQVERYKESEPEPKPTLTPDLCRAGCKHFDYVRAGDEFCFERFNGKPIPLNIPCKQFEEKHPEVLPKGVLTL